MYQKIKDSLPIINIIILIILAFLIINNKRDTLLNKNISVYEKQIKEIKKEKEIIKDSIEENNIKLKEYDVLIDNIKKENEILKSKLIVNKKNADIKKDSYNNNTISDRIDLFSRIINIKDQGFSSTKDSI